MESVRFAEGRSSAPLPISQIAIVVKEEGLEKYYRVLDRGPWNVYEPRPRARYDKVILEFGPAEAVDVKPAQLYPAE